MLVNIQFSNYEKKLKYDLEDTIKIIEIKELIEKEENMQFNKNEIKLIFSGRVLDNNKSLKDIKFVSGNTFTALGKKIIQEEQLLQNENLSNENLSNNNETNNNETNTLLNQFFEIGNIFFPPNLNESNNNNILPNHIEEALSYYQIPTENELLNSKLLKYKSLLNNVINNNTFCEFIKNKDNINLISNNPTIISNEDYKNSARNLIGTLNITTPNFFYIFLIPTISKYKEINNLTNSSNEIIVDNIFNMIDEWLNEYNESNPPINISNNENLNQGNINNPLFNMLNSLLTGVLNNTNIEQEEYINEEDDDEDEDDINIINPPSNNQILQEKVEQMKELGLLDENKCKLCLNLAGGDIESAINYYYEINIDY
jgi:hypothetical protein